METTYLIYGAVATIVLSISSYFVQRRLKEVQARHDKSTAELRAEYDRLNKNINALHTDLKMAFPEIQQREN